MYRRRTFKTPKCMTIVHSVGLDSMMVLSVRTLVKSVTPFDTNHFIELNVLCTKKKSHITKIFTGP